MGVSRTFDRITLSLNKQLRRVLITHSERKNIKRKKALVAKVSLSKEQKAEIRAFYKQHYGKAVPLHWHRLYQSYTGKFQKDYFPEILLSTKLEPMVNCYREAEFLGDKNLLETLFFGVEGVRIPRTYVSCVKGLFRDGEGKPISRNEAVRCISDIGVCVMKKTVDTSSGRDVMLCDFEGGVNKKDSASAEKLCSEFGKNFVVQEMISQSPVLAKLNHTSVNTFRVMSYICDGDIYVCPLALRLGRSNADKDNIHYGGICVGVCEDGTLRKQAFSEYGETFDAHPDSHVVFEEYEISAVGKLREAAKRLHARLPHLGVISWDLTLDENDEPVLIEMNSTGQSAWFPQMVNGEPLFGENTEKMLKSIR